MPPFKPFTSFLNQGMQNTNKNINNPYSFTNSLTGNPQNMYGFTPPAGGFAGQGAGQGGGGGGGGGLFDPGEGSDDQGGGGSVDPSPFDPIGGHGVTPEPSDEALELQEMQQSWQQIYNYLFSQGIKPGEPAYLQAHQWIWGSGYPDYNNNLQYSTDEIQQMLYSEYIWEEPGGEVSDIPPSKGMFGEGETGDDNLEPHPIGGGFTGGLGGWQGPTEQEMPEDELPEGWIWKFINGEWIPWEVGGGDTVGEDYGGGEGIGGWQGPVAGGPEDVTLEDKYDVNNDGTVDVLDFTLGQQQGMDSSFLSNILDYISGGSAAQDIEPPPEATGVAGTPKRGISGKLAKKLYYPSTSGGFASTGSGIGGGTSTLSDLLKRMQG